MYFRLLVTSGFHVKAEIEIFAAASSRCRQILKYKNLRRHFEDYVKKLHQKACRPFSTIIFLHSTNQIIDLWRFRFRRRRLFLNSLLPVCILNWPLPIGAFQGQWNKLNKLRIPTGRRQTNCKSAAEEDLCKSAAEELNQAPPGKNPADGQGRVLPISSRLKSGFDWNRIEIGFSRFQVRRPNLSATLPPPKKDTSTWRSRKQTQRLLFVRYF